MCDQRLDVDATLPDWQHGVRLAKSHPRIVATAHGNPYDPATNSGVSRRLLHALEAECDIVGTVSSAPSNGEQQFARIISFAPTKSAWRSRYRLSMYQVDASSKAAARGLDTLSGQAYDAFLQIGTYFDASGLVRQPIFTYVDHDLPSLVRIDPRMRGTSLDARYVRQRIEHEQHVFEKCATVFTFSEWCKERIAEDYGIPRERIESVGAGSNIDVALLEREPAYDAQHAVFIGFDFDRKGGKEVLAAFPRVLSEIPSARLTIVGGLPEGHISPGVYATGRLTGPNSAERIADILASSSLYVMPSVFEPFGIAFLEAMAAGLPCIGSDLCAMPEIIGATGAIVSPGDPEQLAYAMIDYLRAPDLCRRKGREARARYHDRYGWDSVATKIGATIIRVLENDAS